MTVYRIERYSGIGNFWETIKHRNKSFFFDVDKARDYKAEFEEKTKISTRLVEEEIFDGDIMRWRIVE